ncbi:MAG: phosphate ABC transporter ATP-binding protein [Synergistaceae bacterium]
MENCVEIRGLSVAFHGRTALDSVSADIPKDGITVLLGRSGSGKTTLLRSLNRLNETFDGYCGSGSVKLLLGGRMADAYSEDISLTELRRRVGMVFQVPNPLPVSIRKNMMLPMQLVLRMGKKEAEARMEEALCAVGLWSEVRDRMSASAMSISGGQQQRLCLARALTLEPDILLLDEPTASLDKKSSELIEEHLLSLKGRYPMVMVSHSLVQAQKLADRFIAVREGRIAAVLGREDLPAGGGEKVLAGLL